MIFCLSVSTCQFDVISCCWSTTFALKSSTAPTQKHNYSTTNFIRWWNMKMLKQNNKLILCKCNCNELNLSRMRLQAYILFPNAALFYLIHFSLPAQP
jgi:hypothetical protein